MNLYDLSSAVSKFAPILGSVISSTNPIAGLVVSMIAQLFGAKSSDVKDIMDKMNGDLNAGNKLKELEIQHQDILSSNETQDRESAREREEIVMKQTGHADYILNVISMTVIIGFFAMASIIFFFPMPSGAHDVINMVFGQLTAGLIMVLHYYFG